MSYARLNIQKLTFVVALSTLVAVGCADDDPVAEATDAGSDDARRDDIGAADMGGNDTSRDTNTSDGTNSDANEDTRTDIAPRDTSTDAGEDTAADTGSDAGEDGQTDADGDTAGDSSGDTVGDSSDDTADTSGSADCGNGAQEGEEACDYGPINGEGGRCSVDCEVVAVCGDYVVDGDEPCDGEGSACSAGGLCTDACACEAATCPAASETIIDLADSRVAETFVWHYEGAFGSAEAAGFELPCADYEGTDNDAQANMPDVVFQFTLPEGAPEGVYYATTVGDPTGESDAVDTVLAVFDTECDIDAPILNCNDDNDFQFVDPDTGDYDSYLSTAGVFLEPGDKVIIVVDAFDDSEFGNNFVLEVGQVSVLESAAECDTFDHESFCDRDADLYCDTGDEVSVGTCAVDDRSVPWPVLTAVTATIETGSAETPATGCEEADEGNHNRIDVEIMGTSLLPLVQWFFEHEGLIPILEYSHAHVDLEELVLPDEDTDAFTIEASVCVTDQEALLLTNPTDGAHLIGFGAISAYAEDDFVQTFESDAFAAPINPAE